MLEGINPLNYRSKGIDLYIDEEVLNSLLWGDEINYTNILSEIFDKVSYTKPINIEIRPHHQYGIEREEYYCLSLFIQYDENEVSLEHHYEVVEPMSEVGCEEDVIIFLRELINQAIELGSGRFKLKPFGSIPEFYLE